MNKIKKLDFMNEIRLLSFDELSNKVVVLKKELMNNRIKLSNNGSKDVTRASKIRVNLSRILTVIRALELKK